MWYCYILRCTDENHENLTYNGSTNNMTKRLRQHCGLLSGGAKATKGKNWEIYALVTGFVDHSNCLSAEWRIKHPTNARKRPSMYCGIVGRIYGLNKVMMLDKWTNNCKIDNDKCNYKIYVAEDVVKYIDVENYPQNIKVFSVKSFDKDFFVNLEKEKEILL